MSSIKRDEFMDELMSLLIEQDANITDEGLSNISDAFDAALDQAREQAIEEAKTEAIKAAHREIIEVAKELKIDFILAIEWTQNDDINDFQQGRDLREKSFKHMVERCMKDLGKQKV